MPSFMCSPTDPDPLPGPPQLKLVQDDAETLPRAWMLALLRDRWLSARKRGDVVVCREIESIAERVVRG